MQGLTALSFGGQGFLCSEGNLAPKLAVSVIDSYKAGNIDGMMDSFSKLVRLSTASTAMVASVSPKAVLNHLGLARRLSPANPAAGDGRAPDQVFGPGRKHESAGTAGAVGKALAPSRGRGLAGSYFTVVTAEPTCVRPMSAM